MLSDRLQILVTREQRQRLEEQAGRLGVSVGKVVRDAIDETLGAATPAARLRAAEEIVAMEAVFVAPEELERILEEERERPFSALLDDRPAP
jgi:ribosome maturation protein Sdo1